MKMRIPYKRLRVKNEFIRIESFVFFGILATKSLDALNISNKSIKQENNLQRSLIIQSSALFNHDENSMASIDWLKIYGVDAQKLDFYSILQSAAIQHCDGVVGLQKPPTDTDEKTSNTSAVRNRSK
jgi:hypothetical protein